MTDIFLYAGEASPKDVKLRDPTTLAGGGQQNYVLTCAVGAYTYAGTATTLKVAHKLICAVGAYTYTGQAATLILAHKLSLAVGAYTYAGTATTLKLARKLALSAGAYTYTGQPATLTYASGLTPTVYTLVCAVGAYTYTGQAATLTYVPGASPTVYTLACDVGAYNYVGNDAVLTYTPGASTIIGKKPRRRKPIYHPRIEQIVEKANEHGIEEVQKTISRELILQAREVANARTDFEIAKYMTQGKERVAHLALLEDKVIAAEAYMTMLQDEEDFIMVLALAV